MSVPGYFPYQGTWYEFDKRLNKHKTGRMFRYRTYDDQQHRTFVTQRQEGVRTEKSSLSIETATPYKFGSEDKVYLKSKDKKYRVEEVEDVDDNPNNLRTMVLPDVEASIKRLHLNKAR